jgi:hypothetical protein
MTRDMRQEGFMDMQVVDLENKNFICYQCGAVTPFAASGLSQDFQDEMEKFRKDHARCTPLKLDGRLLTAFLRAAAENYKVPIAVEIDIAKMTLVNAETKEKFSETEF